MEMKLLILIHMQLIEARLSTFQSTVQVSSVLDMNYTGVSFFWYSIPCLQADENFLLTQLFLNRLLTRRTRKVA